VVPVVDLTRRGALLAEPLAEIAARVARSGHLLLGPETEGFEVEFAAWTSAANVVAVSSGASALQLALAGLGVGPGDEVIVPAFTAVPTASAVLATGAVPVFADVLPDTATLDPCAIDTVRTDRTKAVIVVHLYGRPADLPNTDLTVVEDAAQAHGAIHDHSRSAAVAYSFYPTKNLGGIGDGGAVATADTELAERIRRLRAHGMREQYVHDMISQNFRMSELEAAFLRLALPFVSPGNERRRQIAAAYRAAAPSLCWPTPHADHVHHLCVLRSTDRDRLRADLAAHDVATSVHYPLALTQQPAYRELTRTPCPQAEAWATSCVTVPCFPELGDAEVDTVASALADVAPAEAS
jgi:dTDP-4-amino-4,6-dideoxygalactose transaminase